MVAQALGFILPPLFINPDPLFIKASFGLMGAMMSIICLISAILFLPGTTEPKALRERYYSGKYESFTFFAGMKEVLKSKSFIVFFVALIVFNMATNLLMGNAPFVNTYLLRNAPGD